MTENSNNPHKILLVEDEANIAMLFKYNLNKAGYVCETANNGNQALEKLKTFIPDLIISDIMMPEMDGYQFRNTILQDRIISKIPFIYLTAKGSETDILEGYNLDIEDYIIKTSSPKIILAKVAAIIKSKAKEREKAVSEVQQAADNMGTKVVPDKFLIINGFAVKHWHQTFQNIPGGDFIDYVPIDENRGVVVLGDVMGKKWKAWYFAVAYAGYVRSAVRFVLDSQSDLTPGKILEGVNSSVFHDERISEVFITLSILIIDNNTKTIQYAGAGDLPIIHKSDKTELISSDGLLLGFEEKTLYSDFTVNMKKGDEIFLFTDGIIESRGEDGKMFGKDRLILSIENLNNDEDSIEQIKKDFSDFTSGQFEDDVSLITIKAL